MTGKKKILQAKIQKKLCRKLTEKNFFGPKIFYKKSSKKIPFEETRDVQKEKNSKSKNVPPKNPTEPKIPRI